MGDIVLRKDETAAGQTYKYAKVVRVHVSTDGKVRAADIEYKLPGESVFRMTTRPIHKLVLIIPIEEQAAAVSEAEEDKAAPLAEGAPAPVRAEAAGSAQMGPPEVEPEAASQEESGAGGKRGPAEAMPRPPQGGGGAAKPAIRFRKVISRRRPASRHGPLL